MSTRPELNTKLDAKTFRSFYYLKEELVDFCRIYALPTAGAKSDISDRIAHYLDTGEILPVKLTSRTKQDIKTINLETQIEPNFICSEQHREFFKNKIGDSFSFNVIFQKWLKSNAGKTYAQAIEAYRQIAEDKKKGKTEIDKQFEYNTYIRDFFSDNHGKTLKEGIVCWKYKKSLQGHNRYEKSDLIALK